MVKSLATGPAARSQRRTASALRAVSTVRHDFDATTTSVVSG